MSKKPAKNSKKRKISPKVSSSSDYSDIMKEESEELDVGAINERISKAKSKKKNKFEERTKVDENSKQPPFIPPEDLLEPHFLASKNFRRVVKWILTPFLLTCLVIISLIIGLNQIKVNEPISLKEGTNTSELTRELLPDQVIDEYYYDDPSEDANRTNLEIAINNLIHLFENMDYYSRFTYGDSEVSEDALVGAKEVNDSTWSSLHNLYTGKDVSDIPFDQDKELEMRPDVSEKTKEKEKLIAQRVEKGRYEDFSGLSKEEMIEVYEALRVQDGHATIFVPEEEYDVIVQLSNLGELEEISKIFKNQLVDYHIKKDKQQAQLDEALDPEDLDRIKEEQKQQYYKDRDDNRWMNTNTHYRFIIFVEEGKIDSATRVINEYIEDVDMLERLNQ